MSSRYIFYGASLNAHGRLRTWEKMGYKPVCFVDSDVSKHYKIFPARGAGVGQQYEILPLKDALECYPDNDFIIATEMDNYLPITEYLLRNGVSPGRVKYFEKVSRYKGCREIGKRFHYGGNYVSTCCYMGAQSFFNDEPKKLFDELHDYSSKKIREFKDGVYGACEGCSELKEGLWLDFPQYDEVCLSVGIEGTRCCCKCIYCDSRDNADFNGTNDKKLLDVLQPLKYFQEKISGKLRFDMAAGEFFMWHDSSSVIDALINESWSASFWITGKLYSENLVDLYKAGGVHYINVSLDSGTSRTYKAVKGVGGFESVIKNLREISNAGIPIVLKYILIKDLNDNETDINGFFSIAKEIKAEVALSADFNRKEKALSESHLMLFMRLIDKCKASGLQVKLHPGSFTEQDTEVFNTHMRRNATEEMTPLPQKRICK